MNNPLKKLLRLTDRSISARRVRGTSWRKRLRRIESLETRTMLHSESDELLHDHDPDYDLDGFHEHAQLVISINGDIVQIPNNLGVGTDRFLSEIHTHGEDNILHYHNINGTVPDDFITLGDFFDTWRTAAGIAGNRPDSILTEDRIFNNFVDDDNTLQMFVNGVESEEFEDYVFQPGDNVVLAYGSNPIVLAETNFGTIILELFPDDAPGTVENFLSYVNDGDYDGNFFHRSATLADGTPFVIQAGGFTSDSSTFVSTAQFDSVPTDAPIQNEPGISNTKGTIAMAKLGGNPDSATSQWFVNLEDNSSNLDFQNGGFTVFGQALGLWTGREDVLKNAVDTIAELPTINQGSPYTDLPVDNNDQLAIFETFSGLGIVRGTAYNDINTDGVFDSTEVGQSGVTIYVDENNNGTRDSGELFTTTDATGQYQLRIPNGTPVIRQELSGDLTGTSPSNGHSPGILIGGEVEGIDFGSRVFGSSEDNFTLQEDSSDVTLDVLANDANTSALISTVTTPSQGGTVTIANDQLTLVYTPAADFAGLETFSYTNTSGETSNVFVTLEEINDPPTAVDDQEVIQEDTVFTFRPLENDLQTPDSGETLRIVDVGLSVNFGLVELQDDGESIIYTPPANYIGIDSFSYTISDRESGGLTSEARVIINIVETNDDPTAVADIFDIDEDSVDNTLNVLDNDTFAPDEDEELTIVEVDDSTIEPGGLAIISADGKSILYTPAPDFDGFDIFGYRISDGNGGFAESTISVSITAINDPPTANDDEFTITKDTNDNEFDLLDNDTAEPDSGETLTILSVGSSSAGGTVTIINGGTAVNYSPPAGFVGDDSFTYTLGDGSEATDTATATITVQDFEPSDIAGQVFVDTNQNGVMDSNEMPLSQVRIDLQGTDFLGENVARTALTRTDGSYAFESLAPGTYTVTQEQPNAFLDGETVAGTQGGSTSANQLTIELEEGIDGAGNDFTELGTDARARTLRDFFAIKRELAVEAISGDGSSTVFISNDDTVNIEDIEFDLNENVIDAVVRVDDVATAITLPNSPGESEAWHLGGDRYRFMLTKTAIDKAISDEHFSDGHTHDDVVEWTLDELPTITVDAQVDPIHGVNLQVTTTNFIVAPESASGDVVQGEGHFHVYVDGVKTSRFYTDWYHLPGISAGEHTIEVELSANDHSPYGINGHRIFASDTIVVPAQADEVGADPNAATVEAPSGSDLAFQVVEDPKAGWNILVQSTGLTLSGENASGTHVQGEGHLKLFANDEVIARIYGDAYHVGSLSEGTQQLRLAAYTNDHRPYVSGGLPLDDEQSVSVSAASASTTHDHGTDTHDHGDAHTATHAELTDEVFFGDVL